ncbi:MAG TPA: hypothetical protein VL688_10880, partial [Verrucomicrobiae bacterium]|nr:hypothetical protein [Verrucomicrobiae bacterium]
MRNESGQPQKRRKWDWKRLGRNAVVCVLTFTMNIVGVPLPPLPVQVPEAVQNYLTDILGTKPGYAYQVNRVLRGSTTLASGAENAQQSLTSLLGGVTLNVSKSLLIMSTSTAGSR